jgi:glycine/D-amino acid oxidase-like deaminating enzyme
MQRECTRLNSEVGLPFEMVGADGVREQMGSDHYCGGVIYPRDGGANPKKLVNELARRAEGYGADIRDHCAVQAIRPVAGRFQLETAVRPVIARQVVIATNGYSDRGVPTMQSRVMPIWVTVAATRALGVDAVRQMSPKLRMHGETGRLFVWSRPSPDGERFIFGGRFSHPDMAIAEKRSRVANTVKRIFGQITSNDIEHVWHGKVAYTMDHAPHINSIDGMWHIGGYCGSGLTRSIYFAHKLACKITGQDGGDSAFDELLFPRVPLQFLSPLVTGALTRYYGMSDAIDAWRAR